MTLLSVALLVPPLERDLSPHLGAELLRITARIEQLPNHELTYHEVDGVDVASSNSQAGGRGQQGMSFTALAHQVWNCPAPGDTVAVFRADSLVLSTAYFLRQRSPFPLPRTPNELARWWRENSDRQRVLVVHDSVTSGTVGAKYVDVRRPGTVNRHYEFRRDIPWRILHPLESVPRGRAVVYGGVVPKIPRGTRPTPGEQILLGMRWRSRSAFPRELGIERLRPYTCDIVPADLLSRDSRILWRAYPGLSSLVGTARGERTWNTLIAEEGDPRSQLAEPLTMFGVTVMRRGAVLQIGIPLLLAALVMLLLHLRNVSSPERLEGESWLVFYDGWLASAVAYGSMVALPAGTALYNAVILTRSAQIATASWILVAVCLVIWINVLTMVHLRRIRRAIRT